MPDLTALTAFGEVGARRRGFGPVTLAEIVGRGLVSVAVPRGTTAPKVKGLRFPEPGGWSDGAEIAAFWTGPGQWMVEVEDADTADLERDLKAAMPGAAVTAQTDGWVVIEIASEAGPAVLDRSLEKLVNLDLGRFGPGSATRTGIEHMSVFVIRRSPTVVAVLGMRSMAGSLWHALETGVSRATAGLS